MKTSCKTKHNTPFPVLNYSKSNKYFPQFSEHPNSTIVFSSRRIQELQYLEHLYKIPLVYTVRNISMLFLNHNNQHKNLFLSPFLLSSYAMLVSSWRYLTICLHMLVQLFLCNSVRANSARVFLCSYPNFYVNSH